MGFPPPEELCSQDFVDNGPGVLEAADSEGALRGKLVARPGRRGRGAGAAGVQPG